MSLRGKRPELPVPPGCRVRPVRAVRRLFPALLFVPCVLAAEPAFAKCAKGECWGGIAFSRLTGYWVYSMNHPDRIAARSRAWLMCEKRCTDVVTVKNGCLALFVTPKGRYAIAEGRTADEATRSARRQCSEKHDNCVFRLARCTADFEELKRKSLEKKENKKERQPFTVPKKAPQARTEELKL